MDKIADALYLILMIVAVLMLLQMLYNNLRIYRKSLKDNLSLMLIACLALSVFECGWKFCEGRPGADAARYLSAAGYSIAILGVVIQFHLYFLEKLSIKTGSPRRRFFVYRLPLLVVALLAATTPWTHLLFSMEESNYTQYEGLFLYLFTPLLFLYALSAMVIAIYLWLFRYGKGSDASKVAKCMIIFVLMAVGMYLLQDFVFPSLGEEYMSMTISFAVPLVFLTTELNTFSLLQEESKNAAISADLDTAAQIQLDALPAEYPAFPEHPEVKLVASMKPAKEVGGDFYDYFTIDDRRVCFLIADVSGKGISAALFMMTAKTMIKDYTMTSKDTAEIFTRVNRMLSENNRAGLFVTAWIGIIDTETKTLQFTNAGHNKLIYSAAGGPFEEVKKLHGLFLAGMDDTIYGYDEIKLGKGDRLFLYTDGITEAHNFAEEMYEKERLIAALERLEGELKPEHLDVIVADVEAFVGDIPQFDDMTMVMIEIGEA